MTAPARLNVACPVLAAAHAGDPDALAAVLRAVQPDVRRYARWACRDTDYADDVAQDALIVIFRRLRGLRSGGAFAGWVFAIVRRQCLRRALGLRSRRERAATEALAERVAARSDDDLRLDLAAAIHSLPDHYRAVLLRRDVADMTIAEIAADTGLTREAVKARLHRARVLVREYLSD